MRLLPPHHLLLPDVTCPRRCCSCRHEREVTASGPGLGCRRRPRAGGSEPGQPNRLAVAGWCGPQLVGASSAPAGGRAACTSSTVTPPAGLRGCGTGQVHRLPRAPARSGWRAPSGLRGAPPCRAHL